MPPASKKGFGVKAKPVKETKPEPKVTTPKLTSKDFKVFSDGDSSSDDDTFKKAPPSKSKVKTPPAKEMNGKKKQESDSSSGDEDDRLEAKKLKALAARAGEKSKVSPMKQMDKKKSLSKLSDGSTEDSSEEERAAVKGKPSRAIQTPVKQNDKVSTSKKQKVETSSEAESEEDEPAAPVRKPSLNSAKQSTSKVKTPQKAPPSDSEASEEENSDDEDPAPKTKAGVKSPVKNAVSSHEKMTDIAAGHTVAMSMPPEDFRDFVHRLKGICDLSDKHRPSTTIETIDWNQLAFKDYTGMQLRNVCLYMIKKRRATRNLWEYVNEVEHEAKGDYKSKWLKNHPEYPEKLPNMSKPQILYIQDLYNASKQRGEKLSYFDVYKKHHSDFQALPTKKQQKYIEKSTKANEEYQKRLQAFYEKLGYNPEESKKKKKSRSASSSSGPRVKSHSAAVSKTMFPDAPELPSPPEKLYARAQIAKLHPDAEGAELEALLVKYAPDYLLLEPKKRMKFIKKCIKSAEKFEEEAEEYMKTHPGYSFPAKARIRSLIEGPELAIWESQSGRPEKPPSSVQELYKAELVEKGEFNPDDYETDAALKEALDGKWKSMNWFQHSGYEMMKLRAEQEYCHKLKEYYDSAPAIMKPLIKATIPQKLRSEVLGEDAPIPSPRKRKAKTPVEPASEELVEEVPKKSKKHKKDKEESEQNEEPTLEEVAAVSKALSHKKKKKITLLNEIVRGIFDARPSLGRSYSVYYYYAKQACCSEVWIRRLDSDGVIQTAGHLIQSYMNMSNEAKTQWEKRQAQRLNTALFQVKQEGDDEENLETMFVGEPVPPPPGLWDYYRKITPPSKRRPWKIADWETKTNCAKQHHQALKQYIRDFENYVLRMTPTDLALYTAAKSDVWQSHSKNTLDRIADNTRFLATSEHLVQEVCPDSEDNVDFPVVLVVDPANVGGQSQPYRRVSTKSVFSNDEFLQQLELYLDK